MLSKRAYRRVKVKDIDESKLLELSRLKGTSETRVGLDVGKREFVAMIRWPDGSYESAVSVKSPSEISDFVLLLLKIKSACGGLTVAMESSGTYGDSIRYCLSQAGIAVHRVSGKASSDYKEIFDGVSSKHDGKDSAIVAELSAIGKSTPWPYRDKDPREQEMARQITLLNAFQDEQTRWLNRIEGLLSRHWPELTDTLKLTSGTLLQVLLHYGSPAAMAADSEQEVTCNLRRWGRGRMDMGKIRSLIKSAAATVGVPMPSAQLALIKTMARQVESCRREVHQARDQLRLIAENHEEMRSFVGVMGATTLCILWVAVGSPKNYGSSGAYLKALGLNLTELSSGGHQGNLSISKRGPAMARKFLYFWALRAVQQPGIRGWHYRFKRSRHRDAPSYLTMKSLVGVMRKLVQGYWYASTHGEEFEYAKVFPGKPLQRRKRRSRREPANRVL